MHYLLMYDVIPEYASRRLPYRKAHFDYAAPYVERGELLLGGALANPVDGAILLFQGSGPEVAEQFARDDPYVKAGLVSEWQVREWTTVVGPGAAMRVTFS